jgi:hypothetical protein
MGGIAYRGLEQQAPQQPAYAAPGTPGQPGAPGAAKGSLPVVLDEKLLKVTMNVIVVKLLPPK